MKKKLMAVVATCLLMIATALPTSAYTTVTFENGGGRIYDENETVQTRGQVDEYVDNGHGYFWSNTGITPNGLGFSKFVEATFNHDSKEHRVSVKIDRLVRSDWEWAGETAYAYDDGPLNLTAESYWNIRG